VIYAFNTDPIRVSEIRQRPKVESSGKLDPGTYVHVEEDVCRLSPQIRVEVLPGPTNKIEMIIISAAKYSPDANCPQNPEGQKISYSFDVDQYESGKKKETPKRWRPMNGPVVIRDPVIAVDAHTESLDNVHFSNKNADDTKVSVLGRSQGQNNTSDHTPAKVTARPSH